MAPADYSAVGVATTHGVDLNEVEGVGIVAFSAPVAALADVPD